MTDSIRDSALDALVRELNRRDAGEAADAPREAVGPGEAAPAGGALVREGDPLERLLVQAVRREATDLLLVPGSAPVLRLGGRLAAVDAPALDEEEIRTMLVPHLPARARAELGAQGAVDFSLRLAAEGGSGRPAYRFRVNLHRQRGQLAAAIRALPREVPTLASLNLPVSLGELARATRGLVLVCGPSGAGKTSTLAALVGEINRTRTCHVVTIEEPIEYEHANGRSIIEQVEVGLDVPSFAAALRASLRQDPEVLLVGEMRDLESVAIALTAAETGHLVLSTLHTSDAAQAIHRIIDVHPAGQQSQIRQQLALALHAILCQQLVPRLDGKGRVPVVELLLATDAVRHQIRKERIENLRNEITLGKRLGMISLEESLVRLVRAGLISAAEAKLRAIHPEEFDTLLKS